ncbi:MAG: hypothetical protein KAR11_09265 [Phycisphaerae bacterium]|nr:hypothetical protein [Phycisphaerae bacterium]
MKIIQLTPGSGDNFYCENCLRDNFIVKALRQLGHDAVLVPLYLPPQLTETGRPSVIQNFNINQTADRLAKLYENFLTVKN